VSCEDASNIHSEKNFIKKALQYQTREIIREIRRTFQASNFEISEGKPGPKPWGRPDNCPRLRDCTEDVLQVRNLRKCFFNYKTLEKRHTKYNGWWNLHTCLRLPTTEIKADIDFIIETKKLFCFFVGVLCVFFSSRKSLVWVANKQTNRKVKNYPRIKNCPRRAAKIRSIRTASESFNCNGVLFAARNFFLKP